MFFSLQFLVHAIASRIDSSLYLVSIMPQAIFVNNTTLILLHIPNYNLNVKMREINKNLPSLVVFKLQNGLQLVLYKLHHRRSMITGNRWWWWLLLFTTLSLSTSTSAIVPVKGVAQTTIQSARRKGRASIYGRNIRRCASKHSIK